MKTPSQNKFRYFIRTCKQRTTSSKGKVASVKKRMENNPQYYLYRSPEKLVKFDLNLSKLKKLWIRQKGKCAHTKIDLELPRNTNQYSKEVPFYKRASLDRIDSNGDYVIENVQFVSHMSNLAKNKYTDKDVLDFYNEIKNKAIKEHFFDV